MARKRKKILTDGQINDQVAADALRNSSQCGPSPTHPAMQATEANPDASATDASQDDDDNDWDDTKGD